MTKTKTPMPYYKLSECLNHINDFYIGQDLGADGKKVFYNISHEELMILCKNDNNLYEILVTDKPRCLYLDIDIKYHKYRYVFDDYFGDVEKDIVDKTQLLIDDFIDENFTEICPKFKTLSASNKLKYSYHITCPNIVFKNHKESLVFHTKLLDYIKNREDDEELLYVIKECIDPLVYSKNRLMRLINQSKFGEDRPLKIYKGGPDDTEDDYFITYNKNKHEFMKLPTMWFHIEIPQKKTETITETPQNEIQKIINHTLDMTINRNEWIKWVWCLKSINIPDEIIHEKSKEGCPEKYDFNSCDKIIKEFKPSMMNYGLEKLTKCAIKNGYVPKIVVERVEDMTLLDFRMKYEDVVFNSFMEMINTIKPDIEKCCSYILLSKPLFCLNINRQHRFDLIEKIPREIKMNFKKDDEATLPLDKVITMPLDKVIRNNFKYFEKYNHIVFKPDNHNLQKYEKNIWGGFKGHISPTYDEDLIQPILHHIKEVWARGNEEHYHYFLSWLGSIIQKPYKKTGICIILQGTQGAGKTNIAEFLCDYVFGRHISLSMRGLDNILQRFNYCIAGKLFGVINELTSLDNRSNYKGQFESLKSIITEETMNVEKKNVDLITIENHLNFIMTTNHDFVVNIEKRDRRYAVFNVSSKYVGDREYFNKLHGSFSQEMGDAFISFLKQYDCMDIRNIPETDIRNKMIQSSANNVEDFINSVYNEFEPSAIFDFCVDEKISSTASLFETYKGWCAENGYKPYSKKRFFMMIDDDVVVFKGRKRNKENRPNVIQFK